MKSFKLKALAVAVLGLAGIGSAFAVSCPTDPAQSGGGAWSSKSVIQGSLSIVSPGMNGTNCELQTALTASASVIAKSFVSDTSPKTEQRYRARFYIDTTSLTGMTNALFQARVFSAAGTSTLSGVQNDMVEVFLIGASGGTPSVRFLVADANASGDYQIINATLANPNGKNRIEFDLQLGTPGSFRYWVSSDTATTSDGSPTGTAAIGDNTKWTGVIQANMGLLQGSGQYRSGASAAQNVFFDEFDSRRQTFIGQ